MAETIIIGLDGGNWELLEPWIERGHLPNIKYLRENGSWGDLISQLPTVTCPNWHCYSTGKNPAKLGVFWWRRIDKKKRKIVGFDSRSFKSKEIFDHIGDFGYRVGVINMPTTYPPKKLNGFMITAPPDSAPTGYTYPSGLQSELEKEHEYRVHPVKQPGSREDIEENLDEILELISSRFKIAKKYLNKVDFLHVSTFYINVLQHFFYDEKPTLLGWKIIDEHIGDLFDKGKRTLLMSDHGIHPVDTVFQINTWLEKEGYLKTKAIPLSGMQKLGLNSENLGNVANRFGLSGIAKRIIPKRVRSSIPTSDGTIAGLTGIPEEMIDWDDTQVIGTGQGTVYIIKDEGSNEYEVLREEIIEKLSRLRSPKTNRPVTKRIYKKEKFYSGRYLNIAPDIVYEQGRHVYTVPGLGRSEPFTFEHKWRAENKKEGMYLFIGEEFKKGYRKNGISILDLTPTILHLMEIPVPTDMDGKVVKDIMKKGSNPEKRKIQYKKQSEKENIKNALKGLKGSKKL